MFNANYKTKNVTVTFLWDLRASKKRGNVEEEVFSFTNTFDVIEPGFEKG